jgi:hypothetical protein
MYMIDAYRLRPVGTPGNRRLDNQAWLGRQPASVSLCCAEHIDFENCVFQHLATTGLDCIESIHNSRVEGCIFRDIGGTGIRVGYYGDLGYESHQPYDPTDARVVCHHIRIANNWITDCSNEYWDCDGVDVAFAHNVNIEHNEISHLNNAAISLGWGWTRKLNCMHNNRIHANNIHHFAKQLYDVAGIYVLSVQPFTEISNNSVHHLEEAPYAHLKDHWHYIYLDEGSSFMQVRNNWTQEPRVNANATGPGNEWENNGPQVDASIKEQAGLEKAYRYLLKQ